MGAKTEEKKTAAKTPKKSTLLSRSETAKLILALERFDCSNVERTADLSSAMSEIVLARAEGRGLGAAVDRVLRRLHGEIVPKEAPKPEAVATS